jgi:hypothetical protein
VIIVDATEVTIYVELLGEGVPCWRPVKAKQVAAEAYLIDDLEPENEAWQFQPGDVVLCRRRAFSEGEGLVAYEIADQG